MNRTFIAAILFAITASNVNAQQTTTVMDANRQYWIAPNGGQIYQPQVSQPQMQSGYYQPQTLQALQPLQAQQPQDAIQTFYYPQSPSSAGVAKQPAIAAKLVSVLQTDLQQVQPQAIQTQQDDYLALPTKSRPPAPSIPPQPGDLIGSPTTTLAGQSVANEQSVDSGLTSVLNRQQTQSLPAGQQVVSSSKALAPAPAIPAQLEPAQAEPVAETIEPATLASKQTPKPTPETPVVAESGSFVGDLRATPESGSTGTPDASLLVTEELVTEELVTEELTAETLIAANEILETENAFETQNIPSPEELASTESLAAAEQLAGVETVPVTEKVLDAQEASDTQELANASESSVIEQLEELSATQELAIVEPAEVASNEFAQVDEIEQPELKSQLDFSMGASSLGKTEAVEPASTVANAREMTNNGTRVEEVQSSKLATVKNIAKATVAAQNSAPAKSTRSTSYGGLMWALIPILGLPFIGWLALRKKKRDEQERRFAEAALHRVNAKKSSPSLAKTAGLEPTNKTVAPKTSVAPAVATAQVEQKAAPVEAAPVVAKPVAATPVAATPAAEAQQPKSLAPASVTPAKDASTAGILSMDDLQGVELTGVDFAAKVSADSKLDSSVQPEVLSQNKALRTELKTDAINVSSRDDLTSIAGIDEATQHSLYKAGYLRFSDLAKASERELQLALSRQSHGFSSSDFSRWAVKAALASLGSDAPKEKQTPAAPLKPAVSSAPADAPISSGDDLMKIRGIGPATSDLLKAAGITTFSMLSKSGTPRLQEILDSGGEKFAAVDPSMWCRQAEFAVSGNSSRPVVETIAIKSEPEVGSTWKPTRTPVATEPVATKSPVASTAPQDDLTKIAGIGPETQEVLRENGIERFEQVGQMTADQLNELLASQGTQFQGLSATTWPIQARALTTELTEEDAVLAQVNSIIDLATSSKTGDTTAKSTDLSTTAANADKATSE